MKRIGALLFLLPLLCGSFPLIAEDATYVYPMRPPIDGLWPPAPYAVNCTGGGMRTARDAGGIVDGVIRSSGGQWEILFGGSWIAYEPRRHKFYADVYYRIGPCWVGGHGHGSDAEVSTAPEVYFPVVHGRPATPMEDIDIRWYPVRQPPLGLYWLRAEWQRRTGAVQESVCGDGRCDPLTGEPATCQQDCCDGICNRTSDIVRCPEDCKPDNPVMPPDPPVECPACPSPDAAACDSFIRPVNDALTACKSNEEYLVTRALDLKTMLNDMKLEWEEALREKDAAEMVLAVRTAERDGLRGLLAASLPADLEAYLRSQKPSLLSGLGRRARYRRLVGPICERFACPEDLR